MIRINLLPPQERRPMWPVKSMVMGLGMLIFLVCIGLYGYNQYRIWNWERQIAAVRNQMELLRPTESRMITARNKQQRMNAKNQILIALTKERRPWYAALARLGSLLPPEVWLTGLSATEKNGIQVNGLAGNYTEVASFLKRLEQDEHFSEPLLIKADQNAAAAITKFEINLKLKGM
ncbi:fimbrial assembly piln [Lucifera butyrica]|uniref:Fimbrial assembly piln n=1 Tax=Lucifera butyrica TaxID=1351585 RepID=A0A498R7G8_9FIRM|nr:PilN domain-containing protein [Lucifera butyrica]VBB06870.1 fimbrial assembly piln [Lucifera butyrica]